MRPANMNKPAITPTIKNQLTDDDAPESGAGGGDGTGDFPGACGGEGGEGGFVVDPDEDSPAAGVDDPAGGVTGGLLLSLPFSFGGGDSGISIVIVRLSSVSIPELHTAVSSAGMPST